MISELPTARLQVGPGLGLDTITANRNSVENPIGVFRLRCILKETSEV